MVPVVTGLNDGLESGKRCVPVEHFCTFVFRKACDGAKALAMQNLHLHVLHLGKLETCGAVADFGGEGCLSEQTDGACAGTTKVIAYPLDEVELLLSCGLHSCAPLLSCSGTPRRQIERSGEL